MIETKDFLSFFRFWIFLAFLLTFKMDGILKFLLEQVDFFAKVDLFYLLTEFYKDRFKDKNFFVINLVHI